MIADRLVDVLDRTGGLCRDIDVPASEADRDRVLVAVNRLQIDLDGLADRLQPRSGVNGTPVPLPPTKPVNPPKPPPPPPPPPPPDKGK